MPLLSGKFVPRKLLLLQAIGNRFALVTRRLGQKMANESGNKSITCTHCIDGSDVIGRLLIPILPVK